MEIAGDSAKKRAKDFYESGDPVVQCRFLVSNVELKTLGSFRVPDAFHRKFGESLPSRLWFKCQTYLWGGRYDHSKKQIYALHSFSKFYGVKIYYLVQLDYYGSGMFEVQIFKDCAVESNYPSRHPLEFKQSEDYDRWVKEEYLVNAESVEYEKSLALLNFNALLNISNYGQIELTTDDISPNTSHLRLNSTVERFYSTWGNGDNIYLRFVNLQCKIEIKKDNNICLFSRGWSSFVKKFKPEAGDVLVLFKSTHDNDDNVLRVCIHKNIHNQRDEREGIKMENGDFYKAAYFCSLEPGQFVVPKLSKDILGQKLVLVNKIEVAGIKWNIVYDEGTGTIRNLGAMFNTFGVTPRDLVIFRMVDEQTLNARVYKKDGMEMNYAGMTDSPGEDWIWKFAMPDNSQSEVVPVTEESDFENANAVEATDGEELQIAEPVAEDQEIIMNDNIVDENVHGQPVEFQVKLSYCHVSNKCQGVTIPAHINPAHRTWTRSEKILLNTDNGSWTVGITLYNDRARFGSGWNAFTNGNNLEIGDNLQFIMFEDGPNISFDVFNFGK